MNRNTKDMLLYSIIALIYAVLFTPLIVSTSLFFPYITGKAFIFRLLVEVATALYIVLAVFDRSFIPKKSTILTSVVVFTAVLGLSTLTAEDPSRSFWSNFERMEGYVTILHLFFFFIVTTSVFRTRKAWYALLNTSVALSIAMGLRAFADYDLSRNSPFIVEMFRGIKYFFVSLFGNPKETVRIAGSLGNSSYLGVYSLVHAFLALLLLISLRASTATQSLIQSIKNRPALYSWYVLAGLFNIIVLYNTGTRGSFVGLVAGVFVTALIPSLLVFFGKGKFTASIADSTKTAIKRFSVITLVVIILVVSLLGIFKNSAVVQKSDLLSRFSSLITLDVKEVFETQGKARTLLWGMAYKGVQERPILGWGQDNFQYVFAKYYDPKMYAQEQWFDRTHNVFFDWLIAGGIVGLLGYLSLFVALLYVLWKKTVLNTDNASYDILEKSVLTGLLTAYFVHNMFIFDNLASYILFFILLAYVNQRSSTTQATVVETIAGAPWYTRLSNSIANCTNKTIQNAFGKISVLVLIALVFGFVVYGTVYKPYMAGRTLIKALQMSHPDAVTLKEDEKKPDVVLAYFKKALAYDTFANTEIRERLAEITPIILSGSKDAELVTAFTTLMANEYQKAISEDPNDPRPLLFLSLYLQKFGLYNESVFYIDKAISLSPTKQSFMYQKGIVEIATKQYSSAVNTFKTAYDLETTSKESKILYALSLIYADRVAEARELLKGDVVAQVDQRILDVLLEKKLYSEIINIAQVKIAEDPTNPQTYMSLAGLYLQMNRSVEAIVQIQKVIELVPDFKAAGELYISEIRAGRDPSKLNVK